MNIVPSSKHHPRKDNERYSASRFALQVALQTMKDRCQKLQARLSCLEEENLQLRLEKHKLQQVTNRNEATINVTSYEKRIAELMRQKSQLSHHILMVATENKELWQRLSKLTEENESLQQIHSLTEKKESLKPDRSISIVDTCSKTKDDREESLEEISLKVIDSIIKKPGNNEEDDNGTVSLEQCGFTLEDSDKEGEIDDSFVHEISQLLKKMRSDRNQLRQQHETMKQAATKLRNIVESAALARAEGKNKMDLDNNRSEHFKESPRGEPEEFEERICPLCAKYYHRSTPFDDFNDHVLSHFVEEENLDDFISVDNEVT